MSEKNKAAIAVFVITSAIWILFVAYNRASDLEQRAGIEQRKAQLESERQEVWDALARDRDARAEREKNRKIAQERYGDLWDRDDRSRPARSSSAASADPKVQQYLDVAWVHEFGAGWVLRAERFGETLHVTTTAEWSRGYYLGSPCSVQRDFVAALFIQFKARHPDAHTAVLLNPGGKEIGKFSRLWGYHCGD